MAMYGQQDLPMSAKQRLVNVESKSCIDSYLLRHSIACIGSPKNFKFSMPVNHNILAKIALVL